MSLTYTEYVKAMRVLLVEDQQANDANFELIIPRMIEYAELRIYRELDFLTTETTATGLMTSGSRNISVPSPIFIVNALNVISPAGTTDPEAGTRVPLERVSLDFLNACWPSAATTGTPSKYALLSDMAVRVAPTPNGAFTAEFIGTYRPDPLSADNATTYISTNLPDLFVAASMIFGAGYLQNFGQAADNPQLAQSWENQYQILKAGVNVETLRQKAQSVQWSPYQPSPIANVPRDRGA